MISKHVKKEPQMQLVSLEQLVPEDHLLRKIDAAIDFDFIYDLVEEKYSPDNGRPSIDPVTLIKIPIIQYMFGIKSMRQTIKEIDEDRDAHGKKPLKDHDDHDEGGGSVAETKEQKQSTTDPESGWFHKGEHKEVFAYAVETACDRHGWILDYTVHPGNEHDSVTFPAIYEKLRKLKPATMVMDAGYKNPAIAKMLIDDGITPVFPYTNPKGPKGYIPKREFIYDDYYDCYLCPEDEVLNYSTTNRDGYREYKSDPKICENCPRLAECTHSMLHQKVILRHIWQNYLDKCEDLRYTSWGKETYELRKETIERDFGTAKEHHAMRYTQQVGKEKMIMKVGLTFACMNMKKLARILWKKTRKSEGSGAISSFLSFLSSLKLNFTLRLELFEA